MICLFFLSFKVDIGESYPAKLSVIAGTSLTSPKPEIIEEDCGLMLFKKDN